MHAVHELNPGNENPISMSPRSGAMENKGNRSDRGYPESRIQDLYRGKV